MYECDHGFVGEGGVCVPYMAKDMPATGTDAPAAAPEVLEKDIPIVESTPEEEAAAPADGGAMPRPMPAGGDCMSPLELVAGQDDLSTLAGLVEVSFRSMCSVCSTAMPALFPRYRNAPDTRLQNVFHRCCIFSTGMQSKRPVTCKRYLPGPNWTSLSTHLLWA